MRENLTLAAQLRLPSNMKYSDKFDRVEKVIKEVCTYFVFLLLVVLNEKYFVACLYVCLLECTCMYVCNSACVSIGMYVYMYPDA